MNDPHLDELEIPQPPYRMSRPVVRLAAVEGRSDEEVARAHDEIRRAAQEEIDKKFAESLVETSVEQLTAPEQVDMSVSTHATATEARIDADPSPDVDAKNGAKDLIAEVHDGYQKHVAHLAAEFSGEGRVLGSLEEEYESTEAALRRAETANNPKEVQRLTKLTQEYSDAVETKAGENTPPAESAPVPTAPAYAELERMEAKQAELRAAGDEKGAAAYDEGIGKYKTWMREQNEKTAPSVTAPTTTTEAVPIMRLTPEQQEALRAAKPQDNRPAKEIGSTRVNMSETPEMKAVREAAEAKHAKREAQEGAAAAGKAAVEAPATENPDKRQQFVETTQKQWDKERMEGEARRQKHIKERDAKGGAPQEKPDGGHRVNLLKDMGPRGKAPIEIPPMPGTPGRPVTEELREAGRQGAQRAPEAPVATKKQKTEKGPDVLSSADRKELEAFRQEKHLREARAGGNKPPGGEKPLRTTGGEGTPAEQPGEEESMTEGEAEEAVMRELSEIEQMGEGKDLSFWSRIGSARERAAHDIGAWWNSVGAKVAKTKLAKKEIQIKALEQKAKNYTESSAWGTFWSPLKYGLFVALKRRRKDELEGRIRYFADRQTTHEGARNEKLNMLAQLLDTKLKTYQAREREYEKAAGAADTKMDELNDQITLLNIGIGDDQNPTTKAEKFGMLENLKNEYTEAADYHNKVDRSLQAVRQKLEAAKQLKNRLLRKANPVTQLSEQTFPASAPEMTTRQKRNRKKFVVPDIKQAA